VSRGVEPPVALEVAAFEDLATLSSLEHSSFSHPWSLGSFEAAWRERDHTRVVVLRSVRPDLERGIAGYAVYQIITDELQIHDLAIHPELRRRGLGRLLLGLVLDLAIARGARVALLEVRAGNRSAAALYRSLGFETCGLRADYYRQPTEDALVLRRQLDP